MSNPITAYIENSGINEYLPMGREAALQNLREAVARFLPELLERPEPAEYKIELYSNYGSLESARTASTREEIEGAITDLLEGEDEGSYINVWASMNVKVERLVKVTFP